MLDEVDEISVDGDSLSEDVEDVASVDVIVGLSGVDGDRIDDSPTFEDVEDVLVPGVKVGFVVEVVEGNIDESVLEDVDIDSPVEKVECAIDDDFVLEDVTDVASVDTGLVFGVVEGRIDDGSELEVVRDVVSVNVGFIVEVVEGVIGNASEVEVVRDVVSVDVGSVVDVVDVIPLFDELPEPGLPLEEDELVCRPDLDG